MAKREHSSRSPAKSPERQRLEEDALVWLRGGDVSDDDAKADIAKMPDELLEKLVSKMNSLAAETVELKEQTATQNARAADLEKKIRAMEHELALAKEEKERAQATDDWIRKIEGGELDEPFPFKLMRVPLDEDGNEGEPEEVEGKENWPGDRLELAAKEHRDPVKLWEAALLTMGSPHSASKLMDLVRRALMILSLRSGIAPIDNYDFDVSGAGALLGKFYAELLPGMGDLKKDRTNLPAEPKHLLGKLYKGGHQFRQAFEAELIEHKREGWAADAARAILMNIDRWRFHLTGLPPVRPYPIPEGGLTWVEDQCERILSPNDYPHAPFQLSPWEKVWSKEWWIHIDVVIPDNGDSFRKEWRALWTDALTDAFARYRKPKTEAEFTQAWKALYAPLARTIPPPKETRAERQTPGGRLSSVKTALRTRLELSKRCDTK